MALNPIDSFAIDHPGSDTRTLQFQWGDLTQMGPADAVDVLVVSALPGDYTPSPGTLIGALAEAGLSVEQLAQNKEKNYQPAMPCWISQQFQPPSPGLQFNRLLVYEPDNPSQTAAARAWTIFEALRCRFGSQPVRVAMPLVSTGSGGADATAILRALSWAAAHYGSSNSAVLSKVTVVAYDQARGQQLAPVFGAVKSGYQGVFSLPLPDYAGFSQEAQAVINGKHLPPSVTWRQAVAVCIYTTNYYPYINGTLRQIPPTNPAYMAMFPLFEAIDSGLWNMVPYWGRSLRRENMGSREGEYQPGRVITDVAYTSTALRDIWSGPDLLQINGRTGAEIWDYSRYSEEEVLFGRNFTFTVDTRSCGPTGCNFEVTENVNNLCGG